MKGENSIQQRVLTLSVEKGRLTHPELYVLYRERFGKEWNDDSNRPRCGALKRLGCLRDSGERKGRKKHPVTVWEYVPPEERASDAILSSRIKSLGLADGRQVRIEDLSKTLGQTPERLGELVDRLRHSTNGIRARWAGRRRLGLSRSMRRPTRRLATRTRAR